MTERKNIMKSLIKRVSCAVLALAMVMICGVSAYADTVKIKNANDARNSVVFIYSEGYTYAVDSNGLIMFDDNYNIMKVPAAWSGSGFAVGNPKKPIEYIVTNAHVILDDFGNQGNLRVYFSYAQNDFVVPTIYKVDKDKDIAVLKLPEPTDKRTALVLCPKEKVNGSDEVSALGYPYTSDLLGDNSKYDINDVTVTRGVISREYYENQKMRAMYQIDAYINHGNSGGPLVNAKGEAVGINTVGIEGDGSVNGAIQIDELINLVPRDQLGYVLSTDNKFNPVPLIIIAAAVVVAGGAVFAVIMLKKKKASAPAGYGGASKPASRSSSAKTNGGVITGMKGIMANRTFDINGSITIGRNAQKCNVAYPIDAKGISGVHCQIRQASGGYEIIDCGSSNGTYLGNGQKLIPNVPVFIPDGTFFYLGSAEQLFQIKY